MKIKVTQKSKDKLWYWKLVARNGRILAHSESYSSRSKACQTVRKIFLSRETIQAAMDVK